VSLPTIKRLEARSGTLGGRRDTGGRLIAAREAAGIEFIDGHGGGAEPELPGGLAAAACGPGRHNGSAGEPVSNP
jgi:hypothetical protein